MGNLGEQEQRAGSAHFSDVFFNLPYFVVTPVMTVQFKTFLLIYCD